MCVCQEIVAKEKEFLTRLKQLKNMQSASLLLRYCGTGRISHLLRSIAPSLLHSAARFHDENISACLQSLIVCELRETQVLQAQLRLSQGGLGLSSAQVTSHCAYLASWASTFDQLPSRLLQFRSDSLGLSFEPTPAFMSGEVNSVHEFLCNNCPEVAKLYPTWESVLLKPAKLQKKLSHLLSREDYGNFLAAVDQRSKARILSASSSEAGVWLDTIPAERQLSFTNAEFQTAVALRLGVPIPLLREVRQCTCGAQPDAEGYHLLTCRQGGGQPVATTQSHMLGCQCSVRWDIAARLSRWSSLKIRRALTSAFTIFVTEKSCCWMSLSLILFARPTWPSQQPQLEAVQQSATRKRGRSTASLQRILATCSSHLRLKFTAAGVKPLSSFSVPVLVDLRRTF